MTDRSVIYDNVTHRYLGVYLTRRKKRPWRAALRVGDVFTELSMHATQEGAADAIVAYLKERYGYNWVRVVKGRTGEGCHWTTRLRKTGGIYRADAWVSGTPMVITPKVVRDRTGAAGNGWATKADARRAVTEFKKRLGLSGDHLQRPHLLRLAHDTAA